MFFFFDMYTKLLASKEEPVVVIGPIVLFANISEFSSVFVVSESI